METYESWLSKWLCMWWDIGQIGVSICPGCAASFRGFVPDRRMARTYGSHEIIFSEDGRAWHTQCLKDRRCKCGRTKLSHELACFTCVYSTPIGKATIDAIKYRDWLENWIMMWWNIAQRYAAVMEHDRKQYFRFCGLWPYIAEAMRADRAWWGRWAEAWGDIGRRYELDRRRFLNPSGMGGDATDRRFAQLEIDDTKTKEDRDAEEDATVKRFKLLEIV